MNPFGHTYAATAVDMGLEQTNARRPHFSSRQLAYLKHAAAAVPLAMHAEFFNRVVRSLSGEVSDAALSVAVNRALDMLKASAA
jgi:hypothetical protein